MAGDGVDLDLDDLRTTNTNLGTFITEFESIGDTSADVQQAVGRPMDRSELRSKVGSFESGWDGNREVILESLHNIHDHITSVIDEFTAKDQEMAQGGEG